MNISTTIQTISHFWKSNVIFMKVKETNFDFWAHTFILPTFFGKIIFVLTWRYVIFEVFCEVVRFIQYAKKTNAFLPKQKSGKIYLVLASNSIIIQPQSQLAAWTNYFQEQLLKEKNSLYINHWEKHSNSRKFYYKTSNILIATN